MTEENKISKTFIVTGSVTVTVDESKFDEAFMSEFRECFYNFHTLTEHMEHLAQLYRRGLTDGHDFIEGYGECEEMGISFNDHCDTEVEEIE